MQTPNRRDAGPNLHPRSPTSMLSILNLLPHPAARISNTQNGESSTLDLRHRLLSIPTPAAVNHLFLVSTTSPPGCILAESGNTPTFYLFTPRSFWRYEYCLHSSLSLISDAPLPPESLAHARLDIQPCRCSNAIPETLMLNANPSSPIPQPQRCPLVVSTHPNSVIYDSTTPSKHPTPLHSAQGYI